METPKLSSYLAVLRFRVVVVEGIKLHQTFLFDFIHAMTRDTRFPKDRVKRGSTQGQEGVNTGSRVMAGICSRIKPSPLT